MTSGHKKQLDLSICSKARPIIIFITSLNADDGRIQIEFLDHAFNKCLVPAGRK